MLNKEKNSSLFWDLDESKNTQSELVAHRSRLQIVTRTYRSLMYYFVYEV